MTQLKVSPGFFHGMPLIGLGMIIAGGVNAISAIVADVYLLPAPLSLVSMMIGVWFYTRLFFHPDSDRIPTRGHGSAT